MFRRFVRRGIQAVEKGQDPKGFYLRQEDVPPTFANDRVVKASEIGGDPDDPAVLRDFGDRVAEDYPAPSADARPDVTGGAVRHERDWHRVAALPSSSRNIPPA